MEKKIYLVEFEATIPVGRKLTNPEVVYRIKEQNIIEEHDTHFVRINDTGYPLMNTYKEFNPKKNYDYEDEVLNHPFFEELDIISIAGTMPVLEENLAIAKELLIGHIQRRLQDKLTIIQQLMELATNEENWQEVQIS